MARLLPTLLVMVMPFTATAAEVSRASPSRSFDCLMEPRAVVKLGAEVTGLIQSVLVDRGDVVASGQLVATLQSDVQETIVALARLRATNSFQVRSQQSRREMLTKKVERVQALQRKSYASTAALDEVLSDFKVAENAEQEAQLAQSLAQLDLERETKALAQRRIKSPVSGIVIERTMSAGEYRNENNHILTIAQIDPLNVEVFLPIAEMDRVKVGSTGRVSPESPIGGRYDAKVVVIDRVADATSGTFGVRLVLPNPDHQLPGGIRCRVEFSD